MTEPELTSSTRALGLARALERAYGDNEPDHVWITDQTWLQGGPDPVDSLVIYAVDEPTPHWHYVAVGLTAPFAQEGVDDGRGWSFELTARLSRGDEREPPIFMTNVLKNLARYVADSGNAFGPGHTMDLHGPIAVGSTTPVSHVMFVEDPTLLFADRSDPRTETEGVDFLQLVGLTADEAAAKKSWSAEGFSGLYDAQFPLSVTHLDRTSILTRREVVTELEAGRARDGSSTTGLAVDDLHVSRAARSRFRRGPGDATVSLGAASVDVLCLLLPLRLGFGRTFQIAGPDVRLTFVPDASVQLHEHEAADWVIGLSDAQVAALAAGLMPRAATYRFDALRGVAFEIRRTVLTDPDGRVGETIG